MVPRSICPSRTSRKGNWLRFDVRDLKICEGHGSEKDGCLHVLLLGQSSSRSPALPKVRWQDRGRVPTALVNTSFVRFRKVMHNPNIGYHTSFHSAELLGLAGTLGCDHNRRGNTRDLRLLLARKTGPRPKSRPRGRTRGSGSQFPEE